MAKYPAKFETAQAVARLDGQVEFTDPANQPSSAKDGSVFPVADATGVIVDTTTYDDTIKGSGKLTTLVFPVEQGALAIALAGDAFPRWLLSADPTDYGLLFSDGTFDPAAADISVSISGTVLDLRSGAGFGIGVTPATRGNHAARLAQVSPATSITDGALPTQQLVSGAGAQLAAPGDTQDVETVTPCTFNPGAGTTATVTVALSPDGVTYSTVGVETVPAGVALDGTIHLVKVRVPAGWYLKLTANAQAALGLTTYY